MNSRIFLAILQSLIAVLHGPLAQAADIGIANGVFLVAKPDMLDPNFRETVVLITEPVVGGGPIGVIVNRPIAARVSEALPGAGKVPEQYDQIYGGGPVARNQMLFLVRTGAQPDRSLRVLADVYLSGDREVLAQILRGEIKADAFRAYAGYAGWAPGQLQNEISLGGWHVVQADAESIFAADASTVWPALIRRIGTRSTEYRVPNSRLAQLGAP